MKIDGIRMSYIAQTRKSRYPILMGLRSIRAYDVVHTNDESGAYFALRSRVRAMPLVAQIQPPRIKRGGWWSSNWRWRYIGIAARNAPVILAPSRWLADQISDYYRIPPERIHAIYYGMNEAWFEAHRPPDSAGGGPLRVVLVNMKGVDTALRAFAKAAPGQDVRLELYGVSKDPNADHALAASLGIEGRTTFAGFVPNEELVSRVAGADLLLHPARAEGFGQVLAEAAALGIPALASHVDALPEVVTEGETGMLAPVDDVDTFASALQILLDDSDLRRRLGAGARARAEDRWRWDRAAERIEQDLYAPLLRSAR